jgi:hypothetical protein
MTLFVEKDGGSDSNACTDAGVGACLTLAGALAKVPKFLNHSVTVNVAAGAYAETFAVDGFSIAQGATLAITGTMTTATLTTGTATGTVTSYAAPSVTAVPSITDSAQSWTASNLRGRFVTFTSGALSGQSHPIYDNTATTITLSTTAASMNGATYTIQDVGSVWTSTTSNRIGRLSCGTTWPDDDGGGAPKLRARASRTRSARCWGRDLCQLRSARVGVELVRRQRHQRGRSYSRAPTWRTRPAQLPYP